MQLKKPQARNSFSSRESNRGVPVEYFLEVTHGAALLLGSFPLQGPFLLSFSLLLFSLSKLYWLCLAQIRKVKAISIKN